jgi:hypothetical protein
MTNEDQMEPFRTVTFETWRRTRDELQKFPVTWVFRGQCDSTYSLVTSVQRLPPVISGEVELGAPALPLLEQTILGRFKRQARNYDLNYVPTDDDALGWLSLLQHHGAPTRLWDWTRSPFVACFFALETARKEAAIWAIDHIWLRNRAWDVVRTAWPEEIVKEISSRTNPERIVLRVLLEEFSGLADPQRQSSLCRLNPLSRIQEWRRNMGCLCFRRT